MGGERSCDESGGIRFGMLRNSIGHMPVYFLKKRLKYEGSSKLR
jgi:hypothetical protein